MKYGFTIEGNVLKSYDAPILQCDKVVTVPEGVEVIGPRAFWYLRSIHGIKLPESVKRIEKEAFGMCEALKWIFMPSHMTEIGEGAFANCRSLTEIEIPDGITSIGAGAFSGCEKISFVVLPSSLTEFSMGTFSASFLLRKIVFMGTQKQWNSLCKNYRRSRGAFGTVVVCTGFDKNEESNPEDFKIEDGALVRYCGSDSTVVVPRGVTAIKKNAFYVGGLDSPFYRIVLPEGVTQVEQGAFDYCSSLKEMIIPVSLKRIPPHCFSLVGSSINITYGGTKAEWEAVKDEINIPDIYAVECSDGEYPV